MPVNKKITEMTQLTEVAPDDFLEIVDVSDTADGPTGTNKKITVSDLIAAVGALVTEQE